ncbi:MAG: protein translocase subunit SecF [Halobacteria archaeon]
MRPDLDRAEPRRLLLLPLVLLLLSLAVIGHSFATGGGPLRLGLEFSGGTLVSLPTPETREALEARFAGYPLAGVREAGERKVLQFGPMDDRRLEGLASLLSTGYPDAQVEQVGEVMGRALQEQTAGLVAASFLMMSLVVAVKFRKLIPALTVIGSVGADLAAAVAFMRLAGVELSFGTLTALVMLIGYGVDSNILLAVHLLRKRERWAEGPPPVRGKPPPPPPPEPEVAAKVGEARRTGLMMSGTTLAVLGVIFAVASYALLAGFTQARILADISLVLLAGLSADLVNTWMLNAGLLRWHLERRPPEGQPPRRGRGVPP